MTTPSKVQTSGRGPLRRLRSAAHDLIHKVRRLSPLVDVKMTRLLRGSSGSRPTRTPGATRRGNLPALQVVDGLRRRGRRRARGLFGRASLGSRHRALRQCRVAMGWRGAAIGVNVAVFAGARRAGGHAVVVVRAARSRGPLDLSVSADPDDDFRVARGSCALVLRAAGRPGRGHLARADPARLRLRGAPLDLGRALAVAHRRASLGAVYRSAQRPDVDRLERRVHPPARHARRRRARPRAHRRPGSSQRPGRRAADH
jgi:hypothetical protein